MEAVGSSLGHYGEMAQYAINSLVHSEVLEAKMTGRGGCLPLVLGVVLASVAMVCTVSDGEFRARVKPEWGGVGWGGFWGRCWGGQLPQVASRVW